MKKLNCYMKKNYSSIKIITEKPRVLIADPFETYGGEEEVAFYIYENIDRDRCDVYITGNYKSKYFNKKSPIKKEVINVFVKGKYNFVNMVRLRKAIKRNKIDIINVHGHSAGFFVRISCVGLKRVRIIWTVHSDIELMFKKGSFKQKVEVMIENVLNRNPQFTNEIITVCKDSQYKLMNDTEEKIPVTNIYNGIDIKRFSSAKKTYGHRSNELILGFFSRLSPQKDLPLLLRSINTLSKSGYSVKLLIAGEGSEKEKMIRYIDNNGLRNCIEYLGFVFDVVQLFERVDLVLLPTHFECLPMILIEAMCSGTPVIASAVGGVPEIVKDNYNGFTVLPENEKDFIDKIVFYYDNRELIETHGKNAKSFAIKSFDKDRMIESYFEVFERNWKINNESSN